MEDVPPEVANNEQVIQARAIAYCSYPPEGQAAERGDLRFEAGVSVCVTAGIEQLVITQHTAHSTPHTLHSTRRKPASNPPPNCDPSSVFGGF